MPRETATCGLCPCVQRCADVLHLIKPFFAETEYRVHTVSLLAYKSQVFPRMVTVRQALYSAPLSDEDLIAAVRSQVARMDAENQITADRRVAIAAGSRGIDRYDQIVRTVVEEIKARGADPFVFPAMGSHGGATADGQTGVLARLGITEQSVGCPIRATMDVVTLGETEHGVPVVLDRYASQADAVVLVNRVKPHTNFHGPIESGLMKMLAIGAGKHVQASNIHRYGVTGLRDYMPDVARVSLQTAPIVGGIAILEDARHETSRIVGVAAAQMEQQEAELLDGIRDYQPKLPVDALDVLIVDRIGKELSGTGMDPNVIGRCRLLDFHAFPTPRIGAIAVLDLSDDTHGNAIGIGMADVTTRRAADKIDPRSTYTNATIGFSPAMAATPITAGSDQDAIRLALDYLTEPKPLEQIRVIHIPDTLNLETMTVSQCVADELANCESITLIAEPREMTFDADGNLQDG